jgi:hypothetical protein
MILNKKTYYKNYLYGVNLNSINNSELVKNCLNIEKILLSNLPNIEKGIYGSLTTAHHSTYNLFLFPFEQLNILYYELIKNITPILENTNYVIKSWVNLFKKGEKIDWHGHWHSKAKVWHGFYCVQVGESFTEYKIPNYDEIIKIKSKEGLLVFGKSEGDLHKSSEWNDENKPRITIAFDIIPIESIHNKLQQNQYIPFKIKNNK